MLGCGACLVLTHRGYLCPLDPEFLFGLVNENVTNSAGDLTCYPVATDCATSNFSCSLLNASGTLYVVPAFDPSVCPGLLAIQSSNLPRVTLRP
jgi:hypothetical protein